VEVLSFSVQLALNVGITAFILRWDEGRMDALASARAWPPASRWAAIVAFGPLCIPVHFVKTRRSLVGGLLGLIWMALAVIALGLAMMGWDVLLT
jgi:hypothetical protein